jgi:MFS family permease
MANDGSHPTLPRNDDHLEDYGVFEPGIDEVDVVPWSSMFRQRVSQRRSDRASDAESAGPNDPNAVLRRAVLLTVLLGNFSTGVTFTILAGSLGRIAKELGSTDSVLVWTVTGPLLASGIFGPIFGKAGDIWGHRRLYLYGMTGACVFALASSQAWNGWSLIGFRVLSSAAGAALGPSSLALIFRVFDKESRVKAMGWWSFVGAGAPVLGVAVGGPLVEHGYWRWLFAGQVPFCLVALFAAFRTLPESERGLHRRFDAPGALALSFATSSVLFGLNRAPYWGWTHPWVLFSLCLSPVSVIAFVRIERRSDHPMLPLSFLRRRNFSAPILTQAFMSFAYLGGFFMVPRMLQDKSLFAFSLSKATALTVARPLLFSLVSPLGGWFTSRRGERKAGMFGALIIGASMFSLFAAVAGAPTWVLFLAIGLSGVGFGLAGPAMSSSVANSVHEDDLGIAGASHQLAGQLGNLAGVQTMLTVQQAVVSRHGAIVSYRAAYATGLFACVLGAFVASRVRSLARE